MQLQNQTAGNPLYRNAFHCAYHVTKTEGIRALYKGFTASLMGLGESALQFVVYEGLKKKVNDGRGPEYRYSKHNPSLIVSVLRIIRMRISR
jgi:hypothetical protein